MRTEGQALVEFALALLLATGVVGAGVRWQWRQWDEARCLHLAFERAHAGLKGAAPDTTRIRGEATCGRARETVELRALESL
jgi:hypothetical protein